MGRNGPNVERRRLPRMVVALRRVCRSVVVIVLMLSATDLFTNPWALRGNPDLGSLRIVGHVPQPPRADPSGGRIVYVDSARRRLYYAFSEGQVTFRIAEYAIDRPVPRLLRVSAPGPFNGSNVPLTPYGWTLDEGRQRLIYLDAPPPDQHSVIHVLDLRTLTLVSSPAGEWHFTDPDRLPGFFAEGLTYSAADDRIYVVGTMLYGFSAQNIQSGTAPATLGVILALDPTNGSVEWMRPIHECQQVLYETFKGSLIARSRFQDALYVACAAPAPLPVTSNYPGHSGVLRLTIDPKGSAADALNFPADFFAISGRYANSSFNGVAAFDSRTDRVFVQSLSPATPGAWVFDGRISSWVGFIPAPANRKPLYFALNAGTGQYYMGGVSSDSGGFLVVSNARVTPIPQGDLFDGFPVETFMYADERSGRFFVLRDPVKSEWLVLSDRTTPLLPPRSADYDSLTNDIEEGSDTDVSFVSGVSGYGARAWLVGGYGGAWSGVFDPGAGTVAPEATTGGRVRPADRAVTLASVPSIDVRAGTASAAAQATSPDPDTDSDLGAARQSVVSERLSAVIARQMRELAKFDDTSGFPSWWPHEAIDSALEQGAQQVEENGPAETTSPIPEARQAASDRLLWPWESKTCLDGGDGKQQLEAEGFGGTVSIACDAAGITADAFAQWGRFTEGPVSIVSTSFDSRGWRDPKTGASTLVKAEADGIKIAIEGVGTLKIGHIESTVGTLAHGRPGTSKATWASVIEQVRVLDAAGKPVAVPQACDDHKSCQSLAAEVTHALMGRIRVYVPEAHIEATEKGAFATVEKAEKDFLNDSTVNNDLSRAVPALQIEIYKDGIERSRLLLQFAAIQANSIYTISPAADALPDEPPAIVPDTGLIPGQVNTGPPVVGGPQGFGGGRTGGSASRGILALLVRSPLEALHAAGLWILFGAAIVGVARRRRFAQQISQGDR